MSLHDRLTEDLKLAMKARDQLRMDVIRMIKAAVMTRYCHQHTIELPGALCRYTTG